MIGIHIYPEYLNYIDNHTKITKKVGKYKFTISYHKQYDKEVYYENKKYIILVDGWIFNSKSYQKQAKFVLDLYEKYQEDFVYYLNGQFNIVIVNKKTKKFLFVNDIYAFRKHFYSNKIISSDYQFVFKNLDNYSLNKYHIKDALINLKYIKINQTFINEIKQISPFSFIDTFVFNNYNLEVIEKKYIQYLKPTKFIGYIKPIIKKVHQNDNILLLLSGGLDSRFMLELLNDLNLSIKTATYGNKISDECIIAKNVAEKNNVKHKNIHLEAKDFIKHSNKYISNYGGLDIFVQSSVYKFYKTLNMKNYIIDTGFALDAFLGDSYGVYLNNKFLYDRVFSVISLRQSAHREFLEDRYSMYDYRIYFIMKNLQNKKENYGYYYELVKKIIKNSFNIPLQSTMFDLNLEPKHWKKAIQIQQEKEKFVLEYYKKYKKTIYHNRYYSDFDMWIRDDKKWKKLIKKLFFDKKPLLSEYIELDEIRKTILKHQNGESHLRKIIKWMTIEMFLKELK